MSDEAKQQPVFPNYEPPINPTGVAHAHPKQSAPLMKMVKFLIKPKVRMKGPKPKTWKKRQQYY